MEYNASASSIQLNKQQSLLACWKLQQTKKVMETGEDPNRLDCRQEDNVGRGDGSNNDDQSAEDRELHMEGDGGINHGAIETENMGSARGGHWPVADPGGDPGVQRNPPFLAKINLAHGDVCSLSNRRDDQFSDVGTLCCVRISLLGATAVEWQALWDSRAVFLQASVAVSDRVHQFLVAKT